ncbi:MAG: isoprenylcysteine carboxylmethyltransferase family protein [Vicinamibacterales bacterium]
MAIHLFQWSGAAAAIFALARTADFLLRVWPSAAPADPVATALACNAILFSVFALHHSLFARLGLKQRLGRIVPDRHQRTLYVWVSSLLLTGSVEAWMPIGHVVYALPPWSRVALLPLQVAGGLLVIAAARVIDPLELLGLRRGSGVLEARGPYRWVRHPLYLGILVMLWTPAVMTGDRLWFSALCTIYVALAIPFEERSLERVLGDRYEAYRLQVRWRLLPGAY